MNEQTITDLLIRLINMLPDDMKTTVPWLVSHYDTVGRPILTLAFTAMLLCEVAIVALAARILVPAARDTNINRP